MSLHFVTSALLIFWGREESGLYRGNVAGVSSKKEGVSPPNPHPNWLQLTLSILLGQRPPNFTQLGRPFSLKTIHLNLYTIFERASESSSRTPYQWSLIGINSKRNGIISTWCLCRLFVCQIKSTVELNSSGHPELQNVLFIFVHFGCFWPSSCLGEQVPGFSC